MHAGLVRPARRADPPASFDLRNVGGDYRVAADYLSRGEDTVRINFKAVSSRIQKYAPDAGRPYREELHYGWQEKIVDV